MQRDLLPTVQWLVALESTLAPLKPDTEEPGRRCRRQLHTPIRTAAGRAGADAASPTTAADVDAANINSTSHSGGGAAARSGAAGSGVGGRRWRSNSSGKMHAHRASPYSARQRRSVSASSLSDVTGQEAAATTSNTPSTSSSAFPTPTTSSPSSASSSSAFPPSFNRLPQYWSVVDHEHTDDGEQLDASRPAFSFTCLIGLAILSAEHRRLPVGCIYEYIHRNFPFFQTAAPSWRNSVRHVLSLDKFFHKPPKNGMKGTEWEVKIPMLGVLIGLIAEGQVRLPPATARHLGLPDLRQTEVAIKAEAAAGAMEAAAAATAAAAAAQLAAAAQSSTIRVNCEADDSRQHQRPAQRRKKAKGSGGRRCGASSDAISSTKKRKARCVRQVPAASVVAAAASIPFPPAAPAVAIPLYSYQQQQHAAGGLVQFRFDVNVDELEGLQSFEASSSSSSSQSKIAEASYSSDSSALSIHDMHLAAVASVEQQQQQQIRRKRCSSSSSSNGSVGGDRRFSTAEWSILPQDDAIISTMLGSAPACVF
eukprot:gene16815-25096_t